MIACGACGAELPDHARFCLTCGQPLQPASPLPEERKVVTSLFCDLVGFTAMSEAADPEDVHALLGKYFALARSAIEAFGGTVEKFIGDAVVGVFGVPAAHEDDPERAVRAGLRIVEAVEVLARPDGSPLELRVGINTGEALVRLDVTPGSGEGFLTGDAVNTAARIQSVAPTMSVAVGRSTFEATKLVFDYVELEPATVKGKLESVAVWQAMAPLARLGADIIRRHDSPLVGREIDLALLKGTFDKTVAASSPQLVTILGEPGLGKSRLVAELFGHVDGLPGLVTWRQGRCLPYGEGITFWALGEIVKAHAGIYDTDSTEVALAKLDGVLPDREERAWLRQRLLPLLGIEASSKAEQSELFTAWRSFLEHIADSGPTVVVLEDLHWADPAMLAFIEHLTDRVQGLPLLIVGTARPDLYEQHPDYGRGLRNSTTINLSPLTEDETARLVRALLESVAVPEELQAPLVERTGGNPLFAEEYVRLLKDRGLVEHVDDQVRLLPGAELPLPDTVQALLAARLDTLSPDHKALLADAAVVGKTFWAGAVAAMARRDLDDAIAVMRELSRKELIRPVRDSSMGSEQEYAFWHVLGRDVAYAQLTRAARATRHVAAAEWIESRVRKEDNAEVLAYHYGTALELSLTLHDEELACRVRPAAVRSLILAADRSRGLDAQRALDQYDRALRLVSPEDPLRAMALAGRGRAAYDLAQFTAAASALDEAAQLFAERGEVHRQAATMLNLSLVLSKQADARAWQLPEDAVALLEDRPASPEMVAALSELAVNDALESRSNSAVENAERALRMAAELGLPAPHRAIAFRGWARCVAGDAGGLEDFEWAISLADQVGAGADVAKYYTNYGAQVQTHWGAAAAFKVNSQGVAYARSRGLDEAADCAQAIATEALIDLGRLDEATALASELEPRFLASGNNFDLMLVRESTLFVDILQGTVDDSDGMLEWLEATCEKYGNAVIRALVLPGVAQAHATLGQADKALELLDQVASGSHTGEGERLPTMVRLALDLEQPELATRLAHLPTANHPCGNASLICSQALLLRATHPDRAAGRFEMAAEQCHLLDRKPEEAYALLGQGRCLIAIDQSAEAIPVLKRAREIFANMGARPALTETETLLASVE